MSTLSCHKTIPITLILTASLIFCIWACSSGGSGDASGRGDAGGDSRSVCPDTALFSRAPIDLVDVTSMGVLGSLVPPGHTFPTPHLYMYVIDSESPQDIEAEIYAPADLVLKTVVYKYQEDAGSPSGYTDFDLHFKVCDDVWLYFIHVRRLTHADILAAMAEGNCPDSGIDRDYAECHLQVDIPLAADEVIGTTGDLDWAYGMDVGVRDYRLSDGRSAFDNPDRWCEETDPYIAQRCYTTCFFDYMNTDDAAPYMTLFTKTDGGEVIQRETEPVCGDVYLDVSGTAQGYWFPSVEAVNTEINSLYLGPNDYLPQKQSFSSGNGIPGLDTKVYTFTPEESGRTNRSFADIDDTEIYCFERLYDSLSSLLSEAPSYMDFTILLQLSDDASSMTVEKQAMAGCGSGPWSFTANSTNFFR